MLLGGTVHRLPPARRLSSYIYWPGISSLREVSFAGPLTRVVLPSGLDGAAGSSVVRGAG